MGSPLREKPTVTLLTRRNCPLCDEARHVTEKVLRDFQLTLTTEDVDTDPRLVEAYGELVPVVQIDGVDVFYGKVSELRLRRLLTDRCAQSGPLRLAPRYRAHLARLRSLLRRRGSDK